MTLDTLKREVSKDFIPSGNGKMAIYETKNLMLYYTLETGEYKVTSKSDILDLTADFKELKDIMERVELLEYVRGIR